MRKGRFEMIHRIPFLLTALLFLGLCGGPSPFCPEAGGAQAMNLQVTSSAFQHGAMIPRTYTCDGSDISPPLSWRGVPAGAKSIALIMDDPDAPRGIWVHWVLFNIPPGTTGLGEGMDGGAQQGSNSWRRTGYGGPCPPGGTHRYYFKVYALDILLTLETGVTKAQLLKAMDGHVLAEGQLMGRYSRK
jgi:Raf kinase inhibitor-like YbhB/YbcL family protein